MKYNSYMVAERCRVDSKQQSKRISLSESIMNRMAKLSAHTRCVDMALLKHLKSFEADKLMLKKVNADFCFAFAKYLVNEKGIKCSSAAVYLQKLHAVLQEAVYTGLIASNPMPPISKLLPNHECKEKAHLTVEEVQRLEEAECPHLITKLAFLFSCYTGLRLSDIETLKWSHLQEYNGMTMLVKVQVKTNSEVRIPLNNQAMRVLQTVKKHNLDDGNRIFPMMSRTATATDLKQWCMNADVGKHVTFHVSRVSFVTLSVAAGIDVFVISKLCGHKNVKTTQIYAKMVDTTYINAITRFGEIFTIKKKEL